MRSTQPISPTLGALLERIVFEREPLSLAPLPPVVGGTWGGLDLTGLWGPLTVVGPDIEWEIAPVHGTDATPKLATIRRFVNERALLLLADGRRLSVGSGGWTKWHVRPQLGFGHVGAFSSWNIEGPTPARWVGPLRGFRLSRGNLKVAASPTHFSWRGVRLEGNYTWHVVRPIGPDEADDAFVAVIEPSPTGPTSFDPWLLGIDFRALELTYGTPLQLDTLVALDEPGNVIGGAGPGLGGERRRAVSDGPVTARGSWEPVLFRRLAHATREDELPWGVACAAVLDAGTDSTIDGAYLKLHVALEGFAAALLKNGRGRAASGDTPLRLLVHDKEAWKKWLQECEPSLRTFAVDEESLTKLRGKLQQAIQPPSSATVADALARLEPPLIVCPRVLAELRDRNIPAHHGTMNRPGADYDVERDVERVDVLRTLMVALLARACGYDGPIVGWDRSKDEAWKPTPSWWPPPSPATVEEAAVTFAHERGKSPIARPQAFRSKIRTYRRR